MTILYILSVFKSWFIQYQTWLLIRDKVQFQSKPNTSKHMWQFREMRSKN